METNIIAYDRLAADEIKITNLDDEEENDIFLQGDHLYFAHVSLSIGSFSSMGLSSSSKRTSRRFRTINFAVKSPRVRFPIQLWINTRSSLRSNHLEPTAMMIKMTTWYVRLCWYFVLILHSLFQDTSPLVYSLTDYRLKQKRPDYMDYPTTSKSHSSQAVVSSSTTLNSTTSLSTDENKRLTSKWLVSDEIQVSDRHRDIFKTEILPSV